jgi:glycosyltransferase involved in cell wall biosynthesis
MKVLWICGLPRQVQREALNDQDYGASQEWPWVLGHLPPPAGVELHIACRTARRTEPKDFVYRGAHFHLVPVKSRARVYCLFRFDWIYFRPLVERLKPDVIHGWGTEDAYSNVAMKLAPARHVVEVQGNLNTYKDRVKMTANVRLAAWNERWVLKRAHHVAAENEYSLGSALPMIRTKSVYPIEHPIRPDFLIARPTDGSAKQVLYLGNIEERKGIWDAIEAFRQGAPTDWKLCIIGEGTPLLMEKLKNLLGSKDLAGRAIHHPRLKPAEIIPLMQSSSIFLLPTRIDTGPTALKEALAMGLWPVCYENSGPQHYIRKFEFGNLAEDLNLKALAETLSGAISAQQWKISGQIKKIENEIRPHFDRQRIWNELAAMYRKITSNVD